MRSITVSGSVSANGGNGGNGATTGGYALMGAGGGAGSGGVLLFISPTLTLSGLSVSGGTAGTPYTTSASNGSTGLTVSIQEIPTMPLLMYLHDHTDAVKRALIKYVAFGHTEITSKLLIALAQKEVNNAVQ
jgi:hypothetical protein